MNLGEDHMDWAGAEEAGYSDLVDCEGHYDWDGNLGIGICTEVTVYVKDNPLCDVEPGSTAAKGKAKETWSARVKVAVMVGGINCRIDVSQRMLVCGNRALVGFLGRMNGKNGLREESRRMKSAMKIAMSFYSCCTD